MSGQQRDGINLDAIRARAEAATAGPWEVTVDADHKMVGGHDVGIWAGAVTPAYYPVESLVVGNPNHMADAEFIAHARTDVPALLAAVAERDAEIERLRAEAREAEAEGVIDADREYRLTRALGLVAALAGEWETSCEGSLTSAEDMVTRRRVTRLRAVLAPVSGAVEGAGEDHRMLPGSHERPDGPECRCGAPWSRWAGHDGACTRPSTPVAEHEQEVRALIDFLRDGKPYLSGGVTQVAFEAEPLADLIEPLAARSSGSSAPVQGGAE